MSARKGRPDAAQQKAKRQKILVGAGTLILLVLMVVEVPKILNHGKTPSAATSTDTGSTSTTPESTPTTTDPTAQPVSATPVASTNLPNAGGASAADGQLVSFSLFQSKDPFRQQLTASGVAPGSPAPPTSTTPTSPQPTPPPPPPSGSPPTPTPTTPAPTTPTPTTPAPTTPTPTTPTPTTPTPTPPTPSAPASASISVNGVAETVAVGASFPVAQPLFRLVSLKAGVARIGVAGGTLQGSSQTVELVKGKPLTLMNTADGMRYVLRLVSVA
jgi:hypothetical protein